jgi:hypothetical protein
LIDPGIAPSTHSSEVRTSTRVHPSPLFTYVVSWSLMAWTTGV